MPLLPGKKNIGRNITELKKDNIKKGKAKGANGTPRPMKQIVAIAKNVLIGALAGKVAGNIVANPAINGKVAKILDSMSGGTRSSLLRYMKNPTNTTLSESALAEILQAKKQIEKVSGPAL